MKQADRNGRTFKAEENNLHEDWYKRELGASEEIEI